MATLTSSRTKDDAFTVIIVGGSVAGLTLAHALNRANINWILLEGHHEMAARTGAGIQIQPNGARVLDQLGLLYDFLPRAEVTVRQYFWMEDGTQLKMDDTGFLLESR